MIVFGLLDTQRDCCFAFRRLGSTLSHILPPLDFVGLLLVVNTIKTGGNTRVKDRVRWMTNVDNRHRDMITDYRSTRYRLRDKQ